MDSASPACDKWMAVEATKLLRVAKASPTQLQTTFDIAQRDKAPVHVVYTPCINLDAEMCDSVG
jgi:hypothetical protein